MSSRILSEASLAGASSMIWPSAGDPVPEPILEGPEADAGHPAPEPVPAGPTVDEVRREYERRIESECARARQEGLRAGAQQEAERYRAALEQIAVSARTVAEFRPTLRHDAERDVVQLAMAIAQRIVRREVQVDPLALIGIVKAALAQLDGREVVRLRVHPEDLAILQRSTAERFPPLQADPNLVRGSLLLDLKQGSLDASLDTQLAEIERGLYDRLRSTA